MCVLINQNTKSEYQNTKTSMVKAIFQIGVKKLL